MITKILSLVALIAAMLSLAVAANPMDILPTPIREQMNVSPQEIQKKAIEHIAQGNLTKEHISQDINATKEELKERAKEHLNESLSNITQEQLQQKQKRSCSVRQHRESNNPGLRRSSL